MSDSTHVDTDALLAFGNHLVTYLVGGRGEGYGAATAQAQADVTAASPGISGMREIAYAGSSYAASADAAGQFLRDTCDGLLALAYVAGQVAETYRAGDAEQADQMAAVTAAFTPPPGQPSIASRNAEAAVRQAADGAVAVLTGLLDGAAPSVTAQVGPRATGGSTVDHGPGDPQEPANTRIGRYVDEVDSHDAFVSAGGHGGSAEDYYDPRAEFDEAVADAERLTRRDGIRYVVDVDEHGNSEVVQADPDDVPHVAPTDYTEATSSPVVTYPYAGGGG
ncbi:hypothetical protein SAMN05660199_02915 [Klenkia soli]|uniref:Excreted virulence factor EspC, type VII ESX diderm n=1 Tax=Klenkia soli TaxID=1052260 RepID=A0A1H0NZY0_9ACTN|nr:hypothetical protein [Klenkia soli]SDO97960.1 hypothetical protein SAMN05660199_02915 [Klenkia soli]